jgi:hypothetical protein
MLKCLKRDESKPRNPLRYHFLLLSAVGLVLAVVDAKYSFDFGATINDTSAWGLAALSAGSALMPIMAIYYYKLGFEDLGKILGAVAVAVFGFNVLSNMGVATSNRVVEVQKAHLQAAAFKENGKAKKEQAKADLKTFKARKASLVAGLDALVRKDVAGWSVTAAPASPEELAPLIAEKTAERDRESARGGCGPKCEARTAELNHLLKLKGVAVNIQKVENQIAATERVLASARETIAAATSDKDKAGVSYTAAQASLYSRWTNGWFGDGESVASVRNANELMGMAMAFVIALAAAAFTLASVFPYLMAVTPDNIPNTGARPIAQSNLASLQPAVDEPPQIKDVAPAPTKPDMHLGITTVADLAKQRIRERLAQSNIQVAV